MKINEDWQAVAISFVLIFLAIISVINPGWMKF